MYLSNHAEISISIQIISLLLVERQSQVLPYLENKCTAARNSYSLLRAKSSWNRSTKMFKKHADLFCVDGQCFISVSGQLHLETTWKPPLPLVSVGTTGQATFCQINLPNRVIATTNWGVKIIYSKLLGRKMGWISIINFKDVLWISERFAVNAELNHRIFTQMKQWIFLLSLCTCACIHIYATIVILILGLFPHIRSFTAYIAPSHNASLEIKDTSALQK